MPVRGAPSCADADAVRRWAIAGEGIACRSWLDVGDDVRAGRLHALPAQRCGGLVRQGLSG